MRHLTISVLALAALLGACVSMKPGSRRPGPTAMTIGDVPLRVWGDNTCGAAALATVLNHFGDGISEDALNAKLQKGRHNGVVSVDLLIAARERGFEARLVRGDLQTVQASVEQGNPAILMLRVLDVPGGRNDLFHYIVVDGIDRDRGLVRMQFGDGRPRWASLAGGGALGPIRNVNAAWAATDYATLLVTGRSDPAAALAREIRRAVLLEETGDLEAAAETYRTVLASDSTSVLAWTNLGNVSRKLARNEDAERSYREALRLAPASRDALNNLAWLLYQRGRGLEEAEALARRAADQEGPDRYVFYDTLGHILEAEKKCTDASQAYTAAVTSAPEAAKQDFIASVRRVAAGCR